MKLRDGMQTLYAYDTIDGKRFLTIEKLDDATPPSPIEVVVNWNSEALATN